MEFKLFISRPVDGPSSQPTHRGSKAKGNDRFLAFQNRGGNENQQFIIGVRFRLSLKEPSKNWNALEPGHALDRFPILSFQDSTDDGCLPILDENLCGGLPFIDTGSTRSGRPEGSNGIFGGLDLHDHTPIRCDMGCDSQIQSRINKLGLSTGL